MPFPPPSYPVHRLRRLARAARFLSAWSLAATGSACERAKLPEHRFYDTQIQPVFNSFCVGNTSPCHRIDEKSGVALGNLDLTSFEAVHRRPDVLRNYGPYPEPLLLLKAIPEEATQIPYDGKTYVSEIRHAGGKTLAVNSEAFFELKRWLSNGATLTGLPEPGKPRTGQGGCNQAVPEEPPLPAVNRGGAAYKTFVADVQPYLVGSCAFSSCHSSPQSDLYLTCGSTDAQRDSNFLRAASFVARAGTNVGQSELLRRPLEPRAGGITHTGGSFFSDNKHPTWKRMEAFALLVQKEGAVSLSPGPGEMFFAEHVMPVMIRRGCQFEGCHSPNGFNDFRLRPGALGFLSPFALRRNYENTLHEFMNLDTPDVRQSRIVRKNILAADGGIIHRAGALLQSPNEELSGPTDPCPAPFAAATASAFCTIKEWHRLERAERAASVSPLSAASTIPIAFVSRPPNPDSLLAFDTFRGGADLKLGDATIGANGRVESVGNLRSGLSACAGLAGRTDLDVRGPEFSYDGAQLAFAARVGEAGGLDLWTVDAAGTTCTRLTSDNGRMAGPVKVHNFDPVFAPNGALVFASTRAGTVTLKTLLPNADLYRVGTDLDFAKAERMTVLTNSELSPAFMANGQVSFTAEKATPEFYQLSGRRINWDLSDYHPLIAQRAQSPDTFGGKLRPSVNYQQATEIREDLDRNFMVILSDTGSLGGGGALGLFNRSVGPFEEGRNEVTFLRSLVLADPAAHGRMGTQGVYRAPYPSPNGEILASFAANVANPAADVPRYDLVLIDQHSHARRILVPGGTESLVEAALGYKRAGRLLFRNYLQLVFGGHSVGRADQAIMHVPDFPVLATLLGANLRRGRNVGGFDKGTILRAYEVSPPSSRTPDAASLLGTQRVYTQRRSLGGATLEADKSIRVALPVLKPFILELADDDGKAVFTMQEEHQMGPGEIISPGVTRKLFNGICGGCHGSISGKELDVVVTPDALTGASISISRDMTPKALK